VVTVTVSRRSIRSFQVISITFIWVDGLNLLDTFMYLYFVNDLWFLGGQFLFDIEYVIVTDVVDRW
jgi:hypothetical protein